MYAFVLFDAYKNDSHACVCLYINNHAYSLYLDKDWLIILYLNKDWLVRSLEARNTQKYEKKNRLGLNESAHDK